MARHRALAVALVLGGLVAAAVPPSASAATTGRAASQRAAATGGDPAGAVVDWSLVAQNSVVVVAKKFPGEGAVLMGIVHAAIYDATVAVDGGYRPYAVRLDAPRHTSLAAAVATAAHGVLVGLFPDQQGGDAGLDATYAAYLAAIPDGRAKADGIAVGARVAQGILRLRADDGRNAVVPYVQAPPGPGVYEPTGPVVLGTNLPHVRPLVLRGADQFRPAAPAPLTSRRYARDYDEVLRYGRADSTVRTPEQTATALFWTDNDIAQWNRGMLRLAASEDLNAVQTARMLALAHLAGGDGMIACFDAKFHYRFWRPVHAIPRAATDGNPATAPDPSWTPLRTTPPFPEYPSAHACHSGAVTTVLSALFGSGRVDFSLDSLVTGQTRSYRRFADVLREVNDARVWAGFHFRSSDVAGSVLGTRVGRFVVDHALQPAG
ncbi:MAG TPA: vanadium-dependent haloperoxidase [Actinomycetes bacterium]